MPGILDHNFITRSIKHYEIAVNCFDSHELKWNIIYTKQLYPARNVTHSGYFARSFCESSFNTSCQICDLLASSRICRSFFTRNSWRFLENAHLCIVRATLEIVERCSEGGHKGLTVLHDFYDCEIYICCWSTLKPFQCRRRDWFSMVCHWFY